MSTFIPNKSLVIKTETYLSKYGIIVEWSHKCTECSQHNPLRNVRT